MGKQSLGNGKARKRKGIEKGWAKNKQTNKQTNKTNKINIQNKKQKSKNHLGDISVRHRRRRVGLSFIHRTGRSRETKKFD